MYSKEIREHAKRLRGAGNSYNTISGLLGIPVSTIITWVSVVRLTKNQERKLKLKGNLASIKVVRKNKKLRYKNWESEATSLWEVRKNDHLFLAGVALYWGEGRKKDKFTLTNSDYRMLRVWLAWCKKYISEVALSACLNIHNTVDEKLAIKFWRTKLGFNGPVYISKSYSVPKQKAFKNLENGTLQITAKKGGTECSVKMKTWVDLLSKFWGGSVTG